MKTKETVLSLISISLFVLCFALTLPIVWRPLAEKILPPVQESGTAEQTEPAVTDPSESGTVPAPEDTSAAETLPDDSTEPGRAATETVPETSDEASLTLPVTGAESSETSAVPVPDGTTEEEAATSAIGPDETTSVQPVSFNGWKTVEKSYFSDALFIGDSRTVGIRDGTYGPFENACFFCGESWTCGYALYCTTSVETGTDKTAKRRQLGQYTLNGLLSSPDFKFGKIYIMFGLNEIGSDPEDVAKTVGKMIDMCRTLCPDAIIFAEANLYMTPGFVEKNAKNGKPFYNNEKLAAINAGIAAYADWEHVFYLDINELMGDGKGNASTEYCTDGYAHPNWKHYRTWGEWLYSKGV